MAEVVRIVSLWIHPGQEVAFEAFEREAASIMAVHGGRIERAIRVRSGEGESPHEVHVVVFPSESAWESYRVDPKTQNLVQRRNLIIAKTSIMTGQTVGPY